MRLIGHGQPQLLQKMIYSIFSLQIITEKQLIFSYTVYK